MHICLSVRSFRCGKENKSIPLLFDCRVPIHVHGYFVGETLAKKALRDFVFVLPLLSFELLCVREIDWVLGNRGLAGALEVTPATGRYHRSAETVGKRCPIGNFRFEVRDVDK